MVEHDWKIFGTTELAEKDRVLVTWKCTACAFYARTVRMISSDGTPLTPNQLAREDEAGLADLKDLHAKEECKGATTGDKTNG